MTFRRFALSQIAPTIGFALLLLSGCHRGPSPVEFEKPVLDVPILVDKTEAEAVQILGEPYSRRIHKPIGGAIHILNWRNKEETVGWSITYDERTGLPYSFSVGLKPETFSTQPQLLEALNLKFDDKRFKITFGKDSKNPNILTDGTDERVIYFDIYAVEIARKTEFDNRPEVKEFWHRTMPNQFP